MQDETSELSSLVKTKSGISSVEENGKHIIVSASVIHEKFAVVLLSILVRYRVPTLQLFLTNNDIIFFSLTWLTIMFLSWLDNTEGADFIC